MIKFIVIVIISVLPVSNLWAEVIYYSEPEAIIFVHITNTRHLEVWRYKKNVLIEPNMKAKKINIQNTIEDALAAYFMVYELRREDWNAEDAARIEKMMSPGLRKKNVSVQELASRLKKTKKEVLSRKITKSIKRTLLYKIRRDNIFGLLVRYERTIDGKQDAYQLDYFLKKKNGIWQILRDRDDDRVIRLRSDISHLLSIAEEGVPFSQTKYTTFTTTKMRSFRDVWKKFKLNY